MKTLFISLLSSFIPLILKYFCLCLIVPSQIQMEDRESKRESERNEGDHSLWTKESFNLSEETERYAEKDKACLALSHKDLE